MDQQIESDLRALHDHYLDTGLLVASVPRAPSEPKVVDVFAVEGGGIENLRW